MGERVERLRGRRGKEQRERRLHAQPMCVDCKAEGKRRHADIVDHIKPLSKGGTDTDDNCRSLCHEHHRKRTAEQFGFTKAPKRQISVDGWPLEE